MQDTHLQRHTGEAEPLHVLFVDDEQDILTTCQAFFRSRNPHACIHTAASGKQALELLQTHRVDVIVSDYCMPRMNGFELMARVREMRPEVPCILMTAYTDVELAMQAVNDHEADAFLVKPVDPEQLIQAIQYAATSKGVEPVYN